MNQPKPNLNHSIEMLLASMQMDVAGSAYMRLMARVKARTGGPEPSITSVENMIRAEDVPDLRDLVRQLETAATAFLKVINELEIRAAVNR
jgi:hypothetical protein